MQVQGFRLPLGNLLPQIHRKAANAHAHQSLFNMRLASPTFAFFPRAGAFIILEGALPLVALDLIGGGTSDISSWFTSITMESTDSASEIAPLRLP